MHRQPPLFPIPVCRKDPFLGQYCSHFYYTTWWGNFCFWCKISSICLWHSDLPRRRQREQPPGIVDLAACTRVIYDWLLRNSLALDSNKSEAYMFGVSRRVQSLYKEYHSSDSGWCINNSVGSHQEPWHHNWHVTDIRLTHKEHLQDFIRPHMRFSASTSGYGSGDRKCSGLYHCQLSVGLLQCASSQHVWVEPGQFAMCVELFCSGGDRHMPSISHQTSSYRTAVAAHFDMDQLQDFDTCPQSQNKLIETLSTFKGQLKKYLFDL